MARNPYANSKESKQQRTEIKTITRKNEIIEMKANE